MAAETAPGPEGRIVVPEWLVTVFSGGRLKPLVYDIYTQRAAVPEKNVLIESDRLAFALENMQGFSDGTFASAHIQWKFVLDALISDLKVAARNSRFGMRAEGKSKEDVQRERRELEESRKDIIAMMAVSSSARAMEQSGGGLSTAIEFISQAAEGSGGRLRVQDSWAEFLLQKDPGKLGRVVENPLVRHYYNKLLADAGVTVTQECKKNDKKTVSEIEVDNDQARNSKLFEYLTERDGFNDYIAEVLLDGDEEKFIEEQLEQGFGDECRWAAARLACDAFLVDKYTRWEWAFHKEGKKTLMPFPGWGGDPLREVLEPSFLPRRIKEMYRGKFSGILDLLDKAFRPDDALPEENLLRASMTTHLKHLARWDKALWLIMASSQAEGLGKWDPDTLKGIILAAGLINQVYGGSKTPNGKEVCAAMIARMVHCKALASAVEVGKPRFVKRLKEFFGEEKDRPFYEVLTALWGPDFDAQTGLLASIAGKYEFQFKGNHYKAVETLGEAYDLLYTACEGEQRKGLAKLGRWSAFTMKLADALGKIQEVWT